MRRARNGQQVHWSVVARAAGIALALPAALPASAQTAPAPPVYLDSYIGSTGVQVESGRFAARSLSLSGERVRAFVTEVGAASSERVASLSLAVTGFETFQATIGRDDAQTGRGPGLAYFEVWGDDKLLAKSYAIASNRNPVRVGAGAGLRVRRSPENLEVSVRGVRRLRLVTRYASDIEQQAAQVAQARGCVWGDARLTPQSAPPVGGRGALIIDPVRDALRVAVVRLTAVALAAAREAEGTSAADLRSPFKTGVMPLRYEGRVQSDLPAEPLVRAGLEELIGGARQQNKAVFVPLGRREAGRLAEVRAEPDDLETLTQAGRRSGADVVISGVYAPGRLLTLTATLVRSGKPLGQITVPIAAP